MISELTEITESPEAGSFRGWIFYDDSCSSCRHLALRFENFFAARGFHFEPLQREWVQQRLTPRSTFPRKCAYDQHMRSLRGADAVILLARPIWWSAPRLACRLSSSINPHRLYPLSRRTDLPGEVTAASSFVSRTRLGSLQSFRLFAVAPTIPAAWASCAHAFALFFGAKADSGTPYGSKRSFPSDFAYLLRPGMGQPVPLTGIGRACSVTALRNTRCPLTRMLLGSSCFSSSRDIIEPLAPLYRNVAWQLLHSFPSKPDGAGGLARRPPPIITLPSAPPQSANYGGQRWNPPSTTWPYGWVAVRHASRGIAWRL